MRELVVLRRGWVVALGCVASAALAAGCGESSSNDTATTASVTGPNSADIARLTKGTVGPAPSEQVKVEPGKSVWIIACTLKVEGCAVGAEAAGEAARTAGWRPRLFDGQVNPAVYTAGIRQAIAAKADGIILVAIDCPTVQGALREAKQAGIPVVATFSIDCDDPSADGQPLFASTIVDWRDFLGRWAAAKADYVVAKAGRSAHIVKLDAPDFVVGVAEKDGFDARLKEICPDCTVDQAVQLLGPDLVDGSAAQKVQSALVQHPQADVIVSAFDSLTGVLPQVLRQRAGKDYLVVGGEGTPGTIDLVRQGIVDAELALDNIRQGWAAVDVLARVMAKQEQPDQGLGWQLVEQDLNIPESGAYQSPVDFKAAYAKAWGVR